MLRAWRKFRKHTSRLPSAQSWKLEILSVTSRNDAKVKKARSSLRTQLAWPILQLAFSGHTRHADTYAIAHNYHPNYWNAAK